MNLNKIVDEILTNLYDENATNASSSISGAAISTGENYESTNGQVIYDKVKKLPYYEIIELSSKFGPTDGFLKPNAAGYELFQKYGSYSHYLRTTEIEKIAKEKAENRSSWGTYWSGVGAVIAIPISALSLFLTYTQSRNQDEANKTFTDSLRSIKTRLLKIERTSQELQKLPAKKGLAIQDLTRTK